MYKYKKVVAASEEDQARLNDALSDLKDDFDYLVDTFDKMGRDGNVSTALQSVEQVSQALNSAIHSSVQEVTE